MNLRKNLPTPTQQITDYIQLFGTAQVLEDHDITAMTERWTVLSERAWFSDIAKAAFHLAVRLGRIDAQNMVTGGLPDPEMADLTALAKITPGAMDVAVAVLVRDRLTASDYRKITSWWAKYDSAWLPDTEVVTATAPVDPEPVVSPFTQPVPTPPAVPLPTQRWHSSADLAGAGAEVTEQTEPATASVQPPVTAPPLVVDPRRVMSAAAHKALQKERRRRSAGWANLRGSVLMITAFLTLFAVGDQLGPQAFAPAAIGNLGDGYGRLICALIWLAAGIALARVASRQFRLAKSLKRKR